MARKANLWYYGLPAECEYVLVGEITGAFPLEELEDADLDSLRDAVAADEKLKADFTHIRAELALEPHTRPPGEALRGTFRLINDGDNDVTIPVVDNGKDPFRFRGWGYVHVLRTDEDKDPARSPQWVGGLNTTKTTTVPAHDSVEWHGNLFVSDYDKGPGTYRYTWEVGKAFSNTVEVQVVGEE